MTLEAIALLVGIVLSIILEVVPGLKDVWASWRYKALSLLILCLVVPLACWALDCYAGVDVTTWACDARGALSAAWAGVLTFLASQTTYAVGTRYAPSARARAM